MRERVYFPELSWLSLVVFILTTTHKLEVCQSVGYPWVGSFCYDRPECYFNMWGGTPSSSSSSSSFQGHHDQLGAAMQANAADQLAQMHQFHTTTYQNMFLQSMFPGMFGSGGGQQQQLLQSVQDATGTCQSGPSQSPIDIDLFGYTWTDTAISLEGGSGAYKGSSYILENNGHTVSFRFPSESKISGDLFQFPVRRDAVRGVPEDVENYRFDSGHFHWGRNSEVGSEHTIDGLSASMELHLVHYNVKYESLKAAIASGDGHAVAVIAVLLKGRSLVGVSVEDEDGALATITNHIPLIKDQPGTPITVLEELDLTSLVFSYQNQVFNYLGSLTTPLCNEVVNWFVFRDIRIIPEGRVEKFREIKDPEGHFVVSNFRHTQPRNGRRVYLAPLQTIGFKLGF